MLLLIGHPQKDKTLDGDQISSGGGPGVGLGVGVCSMRERGVGEGGGTVCILVVVVVRESTCIKTDRTTHKRKIRSLTIYLKKINRKKSGH